MTYPCQCVLFGVGCLAPMTAEDLRCDTCRVGCNALGCVPGAEVGVHWRLSNMRLALK